MRVPFLERLKQGPMVCDGAMGTQLYERGIFLNHVFENINLTRPDLVREIHEAYIHVGADIIETNSFGANRVRLGAKGLADEVAAINRSAVKIARAAAGDAVYIAGSVGPSGWTPTICTESERQQLEDAFQEQCALLIEDGGVDVLMLETFRLVSELQIALRGARKAVGPDFPIVAHVAFDAESQSGDGATPERAVDLIAEWGANVAGVNCIEGPQIIFQVAERMVGRGIPISAQPNAGYPQRIDGRMVYMATPEYFGEYAKRMFQIGVSIVGGCCGTNMEHIRWATGSARMLGGGRTRAYAVPAVSSPDLRLGLDPIPTEQKTKLSAKIRRVYEERVKKGVGQDKINRDNFVVSVEVNPPQTLDFGPAMRGAKMLAEAGVDVINSSDGPRAMVRVSNSVFTQAIQQEVGLETILHVCCRDRNLLRLTSDLFGSFVQGLHNLVIITGDPPKTAGDYPHATAVFDLDSIGLLRLANGLNHGFDPAGKPIGQVTRFFLACGAEPGALDYDRELRRLRQKKEAGAELVMTQPVYDPALLRRFLDDIKELDLPVLVGLLPLASLQNALFLHNEVPGMQIPRNIIERMERVDKGPASQLEGVRIAQEALEEVKREVVGAYIMPPFGQYEAAVKILETVGYAMPPSARPFPREAPKSAAS